MEAITTICLQGIAHLLVRENLLCHEKALEYQQLAAASPFGFIHYLVKYKIIPAKTIALCLSQQFNLPFIDLNQIEPNSIPSSLINKTVCIQHRLLPLMIHDEQLWVATDDPSQQEALKNIQFHTTLHVTPCIVESDKLNAWIELLLHQNENQTLTTYFNPLATEIAQIHDEQNDAPIVKYINRIIVEAVEKKASDIHFEPYESSYRIRYRQDGLLIEVASPPHSLATRIAARLKIMSKLDTAERRIPQDGRFKFKTSIECRISTCPTVAGEKIVIRLLNSNAISTNIDALQLNAKQRTQLFHAISKPQGMILITGPTGSGKTITLYAILSQLNSLERNISTVEDPVEINLNGINQVQINSKVGLTFASTLRAFLRQDPDIIMIGEIRDLETAEIAVKAAQTGHLILSTLHTNSTVQTITRLTNIGIQPFNLIDSLNLIIAQRLIRCLCIHCKFIRSDLTPNQLIEFGLNPSDTHLFNAHGCHHCHQGYRHRMAIFEFMPLSHTLNQTILSHHLTLPILQQAQYEGMLTLYEAGLELVKTGVTSIEELRRVVSE
ncbi:type IV-A pilus assembly ATPase PilB [bacterium]|nr:type IV-A pilus assembly ATPase PilB [bacterium]